MPNKKFDPTLVPLILANLVPLYGVIFDEWSIFQVFFLFWIETAIIGLYNGLKILKVSGPLSLLLIPFFTVHFGGFMFGHLIFIRSLFGGEALSQNAFSTSLPLILESCEGLWLSIILLLISHGISFFANFILGGEYKDSNPARQMISPYSRVIVMHLTIIFGGWIVMGFENTIGALALLVIGKIIMDVKAHLKSHQQKSALPSENTDRKDILSLITKTINEQVMQHKIATSKQESIQNQTDVQS